MGSGEDGSHTGERHCSDGSGLGVVLLGSSTAMNSGGIHLPFSCNTLV